MSAPTFSNWVYYTFAAVFLTGVYAAAGFAWNANEKLTRVLTVQEQRTQSVDEAIGGIRKDVKDLTKAISANYTESEADREHGRIDRTLGDHETRIRGLEGERRYRRPATP